MEPYNPASSTPSAEILLSQARWLSALARRLAADPSLAEDAVQDTWVAALQASERERASRPWLARVLRNFVLQRDRSEAARRQREREVARSELIGSSADVVERAQAQRRLVEVVLGLDEPYRSTILSRYFDGLTPEEIAKREGVPASTVRTRLSRGIAQLREKLERTHGSAWMAALLPLARFDWPPGAALAPNALTPPAQPGGALAGAGTTTIVGGIAMHVAIKIGAGLVAAAALGWWLWTATGESAGASAAREASSLTATLDRDERATPATTPVADSVNNREREPATAAVAGDALASLLVRATWGEDGTPASGVHFHVIARDADDPMLDMRRVALDTDGAALVEGLHPGRVTAYSDRGDSQSAELQPGRQSAITIVFSSGVDVDGRVVDSDGRGVGGATIWLSDYGNSSEGEEVASADGQGRFHLRDVGEARHVAARAPGFAPSLAHDVKGAKGASDHIEIVLAEGGGALAGTVRDPRGQPVTGAEILVGEGGSSISNTDGEWLTTAPPKHVWSDAAGAFAVSGAAAGKLPIMARAAGFATWIGACEVAAGRTARITIDLVPGSVVRGIVSDSEGRGAPGVFVGIGDYGEFQSLQTHTGADGAFRFERVTAGRIEVRANAAALGDARTRLDVPLAGEVTCEMRLVCGESVAGKVVDEDGTPLVNWMVGAVDREHTGLFHRMSRTDAEGRFRLDNWPKAACWIEVREPDRWIGTPAVVVREFAMGAEDVAIVIARATRASAYVEGIVLGPDERPLERARILAWPEGINHGTDADADADASTGRFSIGPLRAGRYRLQFEGRGAGRLDRECELVVDQRLDLGAIQLEAAGWVRVRLTSTDSGATLEGVSCVLVDSSGRDMGWIEFDGVEARSDGVAPGEYRVRTSSQRGRADDTTVIVQSNEETRIEVAVEPATSRWIAMRFPANRRDAREAHFVVRDATGRIVSERSRPLIIDEDGEGRASIFGLLPGAYDVEVTAQPNLSGHATVVVESLAPDSRAIPIELR